MGGVAPAVGAASSMKRQLSRRPARPCAGRLAPPLRGGRVYTDDHSPVEWLIDGSILKVAAQGQR